MTEENSNTAAPLSSSLKRLTLIAGIPLTMVLTGIVVHFLSLPSDEEFPAQVSVEPQPSDKPQTSERATFTKSTPSSTVPLDLIPAPQTGSNAASSASNPESAASPNGEASATATSENHSSQINLAWVDSLIQSGNYPFAADLLNDFEPSASGLVWMQIRLRQGLCAELRGNHKKALSLYASLARESRSTSFSDAATLASARILIARRRAPVANAMLMRLLLERERTMKKDLRGEVVHALAFGLTPKTESGSLLTESGWLVPERSPTPEQLLSSWSDFSAPQKRILTKTLQVRQLTDSPQGILVTARDESVRVGDFLQRLADDLHWTFAAEDNLRNLHFQRRLNVDFEELPLDILLDAVLKPLGATWSWEQRRLTFVTEPSDSNSSESSDSTRQLAVAERFLQLAVSIAPEYSAAPLSYLLLGTTAARKGDTDSAVNYFQTTLELFPRSVSRGATTLNLGKAYLALGQRDEALQQFFATVDSISGPQADAIAYLYIGRILLENDLAQEAVMPLMRGLALAEDTEYEASAALLLSAAYLLNGNADGANTILVDHRNAFQNAPQLASQAAFQSSLARFWGSTGTQRIREGRALLSSLTSTKPKDMFGAHNAYLVGVAFGAVGLSSEEDATFRRSLSGPTQFPLQHRMHRRLSGELKPEQSLDKMPRSASVAETNNKTDQPNSTASNTGAATIVAAEAAWRRGDKDRVFQLCSSILQRPSTGAETVASESNSDAPDSAETDQHRKSALRLIGLVYQAQGRHDLAVRCLAGVVPETLVDSPVPKKTVIR